jgi:hypothetical protein
MLRAKIRNFQSLESVDFVIDGLTVVTGANNAGKSAVMRAIRGLFQNSRNAKQFVRHGASQSDVLLDLGDHTVRWEKSEKVNRYTVDGKVLDKVGAGVPPEVSALGVQPVRVGDLTLWPQIADQFTGQMFLIDQPGSVVAEAISDTERVAKLNGALRSAESDRRSVQQTLKVRQQDLLKSQTLVERYVGLDAVLTRVSQLESLQTSLLSTKGHLDTLGGLLSRLSDVQSRLASLLGATRITMPDPTDVANTRRAMLVHAGWKQRSVEGNKVLSRLAGVRHVLMPLTPTPNQDLAWMASSVLGQRRQRGIVSQLFGVDLVSLPQPPVWDKSLVSLAQRLKTLQQRLHRLHAGTLVSIPEPVNLATSRADHLVLARWQERATLLRSSSQETLTQVENLQQQVDQLSCEIQDLVGDSCPVCGRS